jgi:glucosyl-3-phosphoglycerate synthase
VPCSASAILPGVTVEAQTSVADWLARRTYAADAFPLDRLLAAKGTTTVSVVLPAREVAETIGPTVAQLAPLRDAGLLDELLVIDAASADGTAAIAERAGATVVQESQILSEHGPARGKGDALWRALHATRGDVVVFVDADSADFDPRFVLGLLGPLLTDGDVAFVKGAYRRPLTVGTETVPEGGGRVTELLARPLLNLHVPELAGIVQPLAGEMAGRRTLLEQLPFPVGYGVEIALLIDALRHVGLDALAQVDLGTRRNAHQPLHALSAMAYAVLVAAERRIHGTVAPGPLARPTTEGALTLADVAVEERPPLRGLHASAAPARDGAPHPG